MPLLQPFLLTMQRLGSRGLYGHVAEALRVVTPLSLAEFGQSNGLEPRSLLFLIANLVTTSKALVTRSDALVTSSFLLQPRSVL